MLHDELTHLEAARAAIRYAWADLQLPGQKSPLELKPLGGNSNVVFQIEDSIVRVDTRGLLTFQQHREHLRSLSNLGQKGVAVGPSPQVQEPLETPYGIITVWPYVPNRRQVTSRDLGIALRRFHDAVTESDVGSLKVHQPITSTFLPKVDAYANRENSDEKVASIIRSRYLEARDELASFISSDGTLQSDLGFGVLHGDGHMSNVRLPNAPILIDFDNMKLGPRELDLLHGPRTVDLLRTSPWPQVGRSWTKAAYGDGLARGYGYDVRNWGPANAVQQLAMLGNVLFLAELAAEGKTTEQRLQSYLAEVNAYSAGKDRSKQRVSATFGL